MPPSADDPWTILVANIVFFGSIGTWILIVARWRRDGCVLEYEPRRPVPWGPVGTVLAVLLAVLAVAAGVTLESAAEPPPTQNAAEAAGELAAGLLPAVFISTWFVLAVALFSQALPSDLGSPSSGRELLQDIGTGALACLAAVLPVFAILALLQYLLDVQGESHHPLVEIVNSSGDLGVLMLAAVAAVVVAPVVEELTFRLLLQGWLEKLEMRSKRAISGDQIPGIDVGVSANETSIVSHSSIADVTSSKCAPVRWLPIIISSLLFAAAHFGYGPEPVPIFILALFLGYVYQRTHRIVPCMVAHGLFNALSMFMLWRLVVNGGE